MTTNTADLYTSIANQGALFNVRREPLFLENGTKLDKRVAIVNGDTGQPISVVSNAYRVVSNEDVVKATLGAIETAKLDTTDATVQVQTAQFGAKAMVRIQLPAYSVLQGANRTNMEIVTLNSYDGSWKYSSRAGGIRVACLNGQVIGTMIGSYSQFHNSALNVQRGAENLVRMIGDFNKSEEWFMELMNRKVNKKQMERMVCRFLLIQPEQMADSRMAQKLMNMWETYSVEMGQNAYALYNAFTDFITHRSRHKTAQASSRLYDENRMISVVLGDAVYS